MPSKLKADPIPPEFVGLLKDWPTELLLGKEHYRGIVAKVPEQRAEQVRDECRAIADRIQQGELKSLHEMLAAIPDEAIDFLAGFCEILARFGWRSDHPGVVAACWELLHPADRDHGPRSTAGIDARHQKRNGDQ